MSNDNSKPISFPGARNLKKHLDDINNELLASEEWLRSSEQLPVNSIIEKLERQRKLIECYQWVKAVVDNDEKKAIQAAEEKKKKTGIITSPDMSVVN